MAVRHGSAPGPTDSPEGGIEHQAVPSQDGALLNPDDPALRFDEEPRRFPTA